MLSQVQLNLLFGAGITIAGIALYDAGRRIRELEEKVSNDE